MHANVCVWADDGGLRKVFECSGPLTSKMGQIVYICVRVRTSQHTLTHTKKYLKISE